MSDVGTPCTGRDEVVLLVHGELHFEEQHRLLAHIEECGACRARFTDVASAATAYTTLSTPLLSPTEKRHLLARAMRSDAAAGRLRRPGFARASLWRGLAAAAVVALAYVAGLITSPSGPDAATMERFASIEAELAGLREAGLQAAVENPSAVVRMQEIQAANTVVGTGVTDVLLRVLERDPNPNVRLAALDALRGRDLTRAGAGLVLSRLLAEPSPLLRSALIDFVITREIEGRQPVLERLERSDDNPTVRAKARAVLEGLT